MINQNYDVSQPKQNEIQGFKSYPNWFTFEFDTEKAPCQIKTKLLERQLSIGQQGIVPNSGEIRKELGKTKAPRTQSSQIAPFTVFPW